MREQILYYLLPEYISDGSYFDVTIILEMRNIVIIMLSQNLQRFR